MIERRSTSKDHQKGNEKRDKDNLECMTEEKLRSTRHTRLGDAVEYNSLAPNEVGVLGKKKISQTLPWSISGVVRTHDILQEKTRVAGLVSRMEYDLRRISTCSVMVSTRNTS